MAPGTVLAVTSVQAQAYSDHHNPPHPESPRRLSATTLSSSPVPFRGCPNHHGASSSATAPIQAAKFRPDRCSSNRGTACLTPKCGTHRSKPNRVSAIQASNSGTPRLTTNHVSPILNVPNVQIRHSPMTPRHSTPRSCASQATKARTGRTDTYRPSATTVQATTYEPKQGVPQRDDPNDQVRYMTARPDPALRRAEPTQNGPLSLPAAESRPLPAGSQRTDADRSEPSLCRTVPSVPVRYTPDLSIPHLTIDFRAVFRRGCG